MAQDPYSTVFARVSALDEAVRLSMVDLYLANYDGTSEALFLSDLAKKDEALLVYSGRAARRLHDAHGLRARMARPSASASSTPATPSSIARIGGSRRSLSIGSAGWAAQARASRAAALLVPARQRASHLSLSAALRQVVSSALERRPQRSQAARRRAGDGDVSGRLQPRHRRRRVSPLARSPEGGHRRSPRRRISTRQEVQFLPAAESADSNAATSWSASARWSCRT